MNEAMLKQFPFLRFSPDENKKRVIEQFQRKRPPYLGTFWCLGTKVYPCLFALSECEEDWNYFGTTENTDRMWALVQAKYPFLKGVGEKELPDGRVYYDLGGHHFVIHSDLKIISNPALIQKIRKAFRIPQKAEVSLEESDKPPVTLSESHSGCGIQYNHIRETLYFFPFQELLQTMHVGFPYQQFIWVGEREDIIALIQEKDFSGVETGFLWFEFADKERSDDAHKITKVLVGKLGDSSRRIKFGMGSSKKLKGKMLKVFAVFFFNTPNHTPITHGPFENESKLLCLLLRGWALEQSQAKKAALELAPKDFKIGRHKVIFQALFENGPQGVENH